MPERWDSPPRSRGLGARRNAGNRNRRIGAGYAARVQREIQADHDAWERSPAGIAYMQEEREKAKQREIERIVEKQDWINGHISDTALKLAAIYGREEPSDEDRAAAITAIGATFTAIDTREYRDLQNYVGRTR